MTFRAFLVIWSLSWDFLHTALKMDGLMWGLVANGANSMNGANNANSGDRATGVNLEVTWRVGVTLLQQHRYRQ